MGYPQTKRYSMLLVVASGIIQRISSFSASRNRRYFAEYLVLPPLPSFDCSATDSVQSDFAGESYPWNEELPVLYTNDPNLVSRWLAENVPYTGATVGFDVESICSTRKRSKFQGPATVQLATPWSSLVIHLARSTGQRSNACIPLLEAVLADRDIVKAGCGVDQDMIELHEVWPTLEARSRMDLGGLGADRTQVPGLKTLSAAVLGVGLVKSRRMAMSDWGQIPLTQNQIAYSARDAWSAAAIVHTLATHDPETFSTPILVERFQSQRSIQDLSKRLQRRRHAKSLLSSLMNSDQRVSEEELPSWKADFVRELRGVMKENRSEQLDFFNVEHLGLSIASNRTA